MDTIENYENGGDAFLEMKEAIIARRTVRRYTGEPIKDAVLEELVSFIGSITPLHDNIPVDVELYDKKDFMQEFGRSRLLMGSHFIVLRSAVTIDGYLQNIGFIGQRIMLWLTHRCIGSGWTCIPKQIEPLTRGQLPCVGVIQFGRSDNSPFRRLIEDSPRLKLHELMTNTISAPEFLKILDAARLAPSFLNMQPARYFTVDEKIYILRRELPVKIKFLDNMELIGIGAVLANIYIQCDGECRFVRQSSPPIPPQKTSYEYTVFVDAVPHKEPVVGEI